MWFVNCAPHAAHRNLAGFQHRGDLYCRTVAVSSELLVDYVRSVNDSAANIGVDAEGYHSYVLPKEEPELDITDNGNSGGDADGYCGPLKEDPESKVIDIYDHPVKDEPESELGDGDGDDANVDGYYNYRPPKENLELELAAMGDGGGDGGASNDSAPHIGVDADGYHTYVLRKEEPELEIDITDDCGSVGDSGDNYDADGYCDYGPLEEDPESKVIDIYYHPVKDEPELELGGGNGDDVDGYYDRNPPKQEPEPEPLAKGDDAVANGKQNVVYKCCYCEVNLCAQEFKAEHELRCKVLTKQKESETQVTKLYHCCYCRCPFVSKEYKEQHQQKGCRKKPVAARKKIEGTSFQCDKCEYVTNRKYHLKTHDLIHNKHNAEWFTCTHCSYKTVHKHSMTCHMKIHGNTLSCCCPICMKSFRTKQCLDHHLLRQHSDESDEVSKLITSKIYTCNICHKYRTTLKNCFSTHVIMTHFKGVGLQKYVCPWCPYTTFRKCDLMRHSKIHGEQKDYQCPVCNKQFTQKTHLDSHVLYNHADNADLVKTITSKIHRCKSCSFNTVNVTDLKRHVRSHHFQYVKIQS